MKRELSRGFQEPHYGIDIGRVIMSATDEGGRSDTSFLSASEEGAMSIPPNEGAFEVIGDLVARTKGRVWLVSKAGPRIQALTRQWLAHWQFFDRTGVAEAQLVFCRERSEKALHARRLKLTHFVDDRLDVLGHLRGIVPHLFLFGHQKAGTAVPDGIVHVPTWNDARRALKDQPSEVLSGNTM